MKIIHCADLHIDSPLSGVADGKLRRGELLQAFSNLTEYAQKHGVSAVIVAGDLFDGDFASRSAVRSAADIMCRYPNIRYFVMRGNHGGDNPYRLLSECCGGNVSFFQDRWTFFDIGGVTVCGRELGKEDRPRWAELKLDSARYNILVLHGDIDSEEYGFIDKKTIASLPVKYVALGHRHAHANYRFGNVRAAYSGVLEARGFDEPEKTGFVLLDTDADTVNFVPAAIRRVVSLEADASNCRTDIALERKIADAAAATDRRNYLNLTVTGDIEENLNVIRAAEQALSDSFFAMRVTDKTRLRLNTAQLSEEISLRGEFVKLALKIDDENFREEVIRMGLSVLEGEAI